MEHARRLDVPGKMPKDVVAKESFVAPDTFSTLIRDYDWPRLRTDLV